MGGSSGDAFSAVAREPEAFARRSRELAESPTLPSAAELLKLVDAVLEVLESEPPELRPRDSQGKCGGLLRLAPLPTVLVPDLHARPAFMAEALAWKPHSRGNAAEGEKRDEGLSLAALLASGLANLVCLGDIFHSEWGRARERWLRAYREYASFWTAPPTSGAMGEEMALSLTAARIVLEAKLAFPACFHCIKGNHDNIADEDRRGDHPFFKFAVEGEMVASWFHKTYGARLLERYRELELALPVLALGRRFVASHGEPAFALEAQDLIEYRSRPDVVEALIWTPNDGAVEGSVERSIEALFGPEFAPGVSWFAGHRPVDGRYALRAGGRFVQFHDPGAHRIAYLLPDRDPDPTRDIVDVER